MGQSGSAPIPPEGLAYTRHPALYQHFKLRAIKKEPLELIPIGDKVLQTPPPNNDNEAALEPLKMQTVKREPIGLIPDAANVHAPPSNDDNDAVLDPVKKQNKQKKEKEKQEPNTASKRGRQKSVMPSAALEEHHDIIAPNAVPPPIDDNHQPVVADGKVEEAAPITAMDDAAKAKRRRCGSWEYVPSEPRPAYPKVTGKNGDKQARELAKLAMDIVDSQHDLTKPPEEWYAGSEFDNNKSISMADRIKNNRRSREVRHFSPSEEKRDQKRIKVPKVTQVPKVSKVTKVTKARVTKVVKPPVEKKKRTRKPRVEKPKKVVKPPKEKKVKREKRARPPSREETPEYDTDSLFDEQEEEEENEVEERSSSDDGYRPVTPWPPYRDDDEESNSSRDAYERARALTYPNQTMFDSDQTTPSFSTMFDSDQTTPSFSTMFNSDQTTPSFSMSYTMARRDREDDPVLATLSPEELDPPFASYGYSYERSIEPMELPENIMDDGYQEEEEKRPIQEEEEEDKGPIILENFEDEWVEWGEEEEEDERKWKERKEMEERNNNPTNALAERRLPMGRVMSDLEGAYATDVGIYYRPRLIIIHPINIYTSMKDVIAELEKERELWFIPTLRPSDASIRGHCALIAPTVQAAEKFLKKDFMNVYTGDLRIRIDQPGAIWVKPDEADDPDFHLEDAALREHLESLVGQVLHFHKHGDGWFVLLPSKNDAKDLIMVGRINGAKVYPFERQDVNEKLINWPVLDVNWAIDLGMVV